MDALSKRIRDLRVDSDMKQCEMGAMLGITQNMVSNYENGREPSLETVLLYARYFDVSIDYLLGLTNDKKPASGALNEALSTLGKLAGDAAPTATALCALLDAAINYYRNGAPCGDVPIISLRGFIEGLRITLDAASAEDVSGIVNGANASVAAALDVAKMPGALYEPHGGTK